MSSVSSALAYKPSWVCCLILTISGNGVHGYSSGASGCNRPGHGSPGTGNGGHTLQVNGAITSGNTVPVTLSGTSTFKGFLVQTSAGAFSSRPMGTRSTACSASGWTHSSSASKSSVTADLTLPTNTNSITITWLVVVTRSGAYYGPFTETITIAAAPPTMPPATASPTFPPPTLSPSTMSPTSAAPSGSPSASPTTTPPTTAAPTSFEISSSTPTTSPTSLPTMAPTTSLTSSTVAPTLSPTGPASIPGSTGTPSKSPTFSPSSGPTMNSQPTASPTQGPTNAINVSTEVPTSLANTSSSPTTAGQGMPSIFTSGASNFSPLLFVNAFTSVAILAGW
eukprot:CAMPEP_0114238008 /NCGR_PEP_ID=MMETSP0058-20121206/7698_1 /TAXON_ID=36894 /ORGANISM="Pyramimonas parkeae, CCMP726" /LENGTH=337 /DNA_ID=CAMNT_0001350095 /DNA_START=73 /DNA_END=1083 /DNA_ORIENTATION=+